MAALTTQERARVTAYLQRLGIAWPGLKSNLATLVGALDDALEARASSINGDIPATERALYSASDKALVIAAVALKRSGRTSLAERD